MNKKIILLFIILILGAYFSLFRGDLLFSPSALIDNESLFFNLRLPKTIMAILAGAALSMAGLVLQTYFENPMAGPFVLGINAGASFGVALGIFLTSFFSAALVPYISLELLAILGSLFVLFLLVGISYRFNSKVSLLIIGILLTQLVGGLISILMASSDLLEMRNFLNWSFGSFTRTSLEEIRGYIIIFVFSFIYMMFFARDLNSFLLGDELATSMGVNLKRLKFKVLIITSIISGVITAACGPLAFVGMIVPHIARIIFQSTNHYILLPLTALLGGMFTLYSLIIVESISNVNVPLNALFGLIGVPFFIYQLIVRRVDI